MNVLRGMRAALAAAVEAIRISVISGLTSPDEVPGIMPGRPTCVR